MGFGIVIAIPEPSRRCDFSALFLAPSSLRRGKTARFFVLQGDGHNMSLGSALKASGPFTTQDVENLIGTLDRDPANTDEMYKFGNTLYGQVPFPAKLFMAARKEMLRRYAEVHVPQAHSNAYAAENRVSFHPDRDGNMIKYGEQEAADARAKLSEMEYAQKRFGEIADSNAATMARVAQEAADAQQLLNKWSQQSEQLLAEVKQQVETIKRQQADQVRITGVVGQIGILNQPVAAPKVAKFKARVAIPFR